MSTNAHEKCAGRGRAATPGAGKVVLTQFADCYILNKAACGRFIWKGQMASVTAHYEVAAGWAGVGVSCALKRAAMRHVAHERNCICETWRMQRWASFRMNTPVSEVRPIGNDFEVLRPAGIAIARSVVIATGNLNVPLKPAGAT